MHARMLPASRYAKRHPNVGCCTRQCLLDSSQQLLLVFAVSPPNGRWRVHIGFAASRLYSDASRPPQPQPLRPPMSLGAPLRAWAYGPLAPHCVLRSRVGGVPGLVCWRQRRRSMVQVHTVSALAPPVSRTGNGTHCKQQSLASGTVSSGCTVSGLSLRGLSPLKIDSHRNGS